jgi:hypothetical protein
VIPATVYANVIGLKVTPNELVLEFGSFFPDRPNVGPPSDYKPELRVVLNATVLDGLLNGLQTAASQRKAQQATTEPKKPSVGFTSHQG